MEILIRLAPGGCRCVPGVRRLLGAARLNAGGSPTAKLRCNADRLELADDRHSSALAERLLPVSCGLHAVQRNVRSWLQIQPVATAHVYSDHAVEDGWHSTAGAPPCAARLGRASSTVSRELKLNGGRDGYRATEFKGDAETVRCVDLISRRSDRRWRRSPARSRYR